MMNSATYFNPASGGASGSRMDREVQEQPVSVLGWGGDSSSRHRPGQVLADLAPWAKVVQTVVCSTFAHGAKPATRWVADGERMNLLGGVARSRRYQEDVEDQGGGHL